MSYNKIIVENGEIIYKNKDLNKLTLTERKKMLGNDIGIIVQDSISSLNPIKKVSSQFIDLMSEKFNMEIPSVPSQNARESRMLFTAIPI